MAQNGRFFKFPWGVDAVFPPSNLRIGNGKGVPAFAAPAGSVYQQTDGTAGSNVWINEDGTATGWKSNVTNRQPGKKRSYTRFDMTPTATILAGGAIAGADTEVDTLVIPGMGGSPTAGFELLNIGAETIMLPVILAPANLTAGLNIARDLTNTKGLQLDTGITTANPLLFTAGTDACYLRVKFNTADASGTNLSVGFRVQAARNATLASYTEFASIGIVGTSNPGKIQTVTNLANAGAVTTDTTNTWADNAEKILSVYVDATGAVTYTIQPFLPTPSAEVAPTAVVAFTFTAAGLLMPFIHFKHAADVADNAVLSLFDCGLVGANL